MNFPMPLWTLASCLLIGCAAGPPPMPVEQIKVPPPASLTAPPQTLPPPASGSMRDLEANHLEVARLYHQMAAQLCSLLAFLELSDPACRPWARPHQRKAVEP